MNLTNLSDEIYRELDEAGDISIPAIAFWLSSNIGKLNALIGADFTVNGAELSSSLTDAQKDIFKLLYLVHHYDRQTRKNLGAAAYSSSVIEIREGNRTVRTVSKNEVAKNYIQLKKAATDDLYTLVNAYKINKFTALEVSVDDDFGGDPSERVFSPSRY